MSGSKYQPKGRLGRFVHEFEENAIALTLGAMTILTFLNVIRRYVFNASHAKSTRTTSRLQIRLALKT